MRTYRGIVCEKNKHDMIFLTSEGEYLRGIPLAQNVEVGDEVPFRLAGSPILLQKKVIGPALIAAVLLIVFVASLIPQSSSAYAYVQVEGKQNIQFGVDKEGTVLSVKSLDESTSIDEKWEGLSIDVALTKAVGKMEETEKLVITTKYEQKEKSERIENAVKQVRKEQAKQKIKNIKPIKEKPLKTKPIEPPPVKEQQQKINEKKQQKQVIPTPNVKPEKNPTSSKPKEQIPKNNSQYQPKSNLNEKPKPNVNKGQEQKNKNAGNSGMSSPSQNNKDNNGKNPNTNNGNNHKNKEK